MLESESQQNYPGPEEKSVKTPERREIFQKRLEQYTLSQIRNLEAVSFVANGVVEGESEKDLIKLIDSMSVLDEVKERLKTGCLVALDNRKRVEKTIKEYEGKGEKWQNLLAKEVFGFDPLGQVEVVSLGYAIEFVFRDIADWELANAGHYSKDELPFAYYGRNKGKRINLENTVIAAQDTGAETHELIHALAQIIRTESNTQKPEQIEFEVRGKKLKIDLADMFFKETVKRTEKALPALDKFLQSLDKDGINTETVVDQYLDTIVEQIIEQEAKEEICAMASQKAQGPLEGFRLMLINKSYQYINRINIKEITESIKLIEDRAVKAQIIQTEQKVDQLSGLKRIQALSGKTIERVMGANKGVLSFFLDSIRKYFISNSGKEEEVSLEQFEREQDLKKLEDGLKEKLTRRYYTRLKRYAADLYVMQGVLKKYFLEQEKREIDINMSARYALQLPAKDWFKVGNRIASLLSEESQGIGQFARADATYVLERIMMENLYRQKLSEEQNKKIDRLKSDLYESSIDQDLKEKYKKPFSSELTIQEREKILQFRKDVLSILKEKFVEFGLVIE